MESYEVKIFYCRYKNMYKKLFFFTVVVFALKKMTSYACWNINNFFFKFIDTEIQTTNTNTRVINFKQYKNKYMFFYCCWLVLFYLCVCFWIGLLMLNSKDELNGSCLKKKNKLIKGDHAKKKVRIWWEKNQ